MPYTWRCIGVARIIETVCGLLIMIGLFTKPAGVPGQRRDGGGVFHDPPANGGLPNQNMGERAVLFCFAFLYIATRGAGIWSVDAPMGSKRR